MTRPRFDALKVLIVCAIAAAAAAAFYRLEVGRQLANLPPIGRVHPGPVDILPRFEFPSFAWGGLR